MWLPTSRINVNSKANLAEDWHLDVRVSADDVVIPKMVIHWNSTWRFCECQDIAKTCVDNVLSYISVAARQLMAQKNISALHHPPYTWHCFIVSQNKNSLKVHNFDTVEYDVVSCNKGFEEFLTWRIPDLLRRMATLLESLLAAPWDLLWRWSNLIVRFLKINVYGNNFSSLLGHSSHEPVFERSVKLPNNFV